MTIIWGRCRRTTHERGYGTRGSLFGGLFFRGSSGHSLASDPPSFLSVLELLRCLNLAIRIRNWSGDESALRRKRMPNECVVGKVLGHSCEWFKPGGETGVPPPPAPPTYRSRSPPPY